MAQLADKDRHAIEGAIFAQRKIEAIKLYREAVPAAGLADAKPAVEAMEASLREQQPEKFTASRKRGCVGVVAGVCLVLSAAVLIGVPVWGS